MAPFRWTAGDRSAIIAGPYKSASNRRYAPSRSLDPVGRSSVWERINDLKQAGLTVLLTTHYMEEAEALCDRVALVHQGTVRAVGAPIELARRVGPEANLEDAFRALVGDELREGGDLRDVRSTRRTAGRLG